MGLFSKELFKFKPVEYQAKLEKATPDELWERELRKIRTKAGSATGIVGGAILAVPTLGVALAGVAVNSRVLYVACKKINLVRAELKRRNLPPYEKKKRDILLPVALAGSIYSTLGILDIILFTGTSAPIAFDAANAGLGAVQAVFDNPGQFFAGTVQGIELHGGQFFNLNGSDPLAIGGHSMPVSLDSSGQHVVDGIAQPSTESVGAQNGYAPTGNGISATKAQVANGIHESIAINQPGPHATSVVATNMLLSEAAATGDHQAQIAGIAVGMGVTSATQALVASTVLEQSGIDKMAKGIKVSAGPPSADKMGKDNKVSAGPPAVAKSWWKGKPKPLPKNVVDKLCRQVLRGEKDLPFVFFSRKGTPISQRIFVPSPEKENCCHEKNEKTDRACRFCRLSIHPEQQPYYHCCKCSTSSNDSYNICEKCVAQLGCSCTMGRDHPLYRKGCLSQLINAQEYEELVDSDDEDEDTKNMRT